MDRKRPLSGDFDGPSKLPVLPLVPAPKNGRTMSHAVRDLLEK
jgi:hypothetical protein